MRYPPRAIRPCGSISWISHSCSASTAAFSRATVSSKEKTDAATRWDAGGATPSARPIGESASAMREYLHPGKVERGLRDVVEVVGEGVEGHMGDDFADLPVTPPGRAHGG